MEKGNKKSMTERKAGKGNNGKLQANIYHNNGDMKVPNARLENVKDNIIFLCREPYREALIKLMQPAIDEYDRNQPNKSRRYGTVENWFRQTFGVGIDDNAAQRQKRRKKNRR